MSEQSTLRLECLLFAAENGMNPAPGSPDLTQGVHVVPPSLANRLLGNGVGIVDGNLLIEDPDTQVITEVHVSQIPGIEGGMIETLLELGGIEIA